MNKFIVSELQNFRKNRKENRRFHRLHRLIIGCFKYILNTGQLKYKKSNLEMSRVWL